MQYYAVTKMAVFLVVAPCSLVEFYKYFRGPCCLHHQDNVSSAYNTRVLYVQYFLIPFVKISFIVVFLPPVTEFSTDAFMTGAVN
jgi:hypothetical protein